MLNSELGLDGIDLECLACCLIGQKSIYSKTEIETMKVYEAWLMKGEYQLRSLEQSQTVYGYNMWAILRDVNCQSLMESCLSSQQCVRVVREDRCGRGLPLEWQATEGGAYGPP
jgi:hypothetical protein